jgi:C4-type Zn-finger protein
MSEQQAYKVNCIVCGKENHLYSMSLNMNEPGWQGKISYDGWLCPECQAEGETLETKVIGESLKEGK